MSAVPDSNPKILTLAEVNAALPRVRQLLEKLQGLQRAIVEGEQRRETLTEKLSSDNGHSRTTVQEQLAAEAEETFNELGACGAMLKDLESGLVDFYGERAGEIIFLCWRLGEDLRIRNWHTLEGGFAGRQPMDDLVK